MGLGQDDRSGAGIVAVAEDDTTLVRADHDGDAVVRVGGYSLRVEHFGRTQRASSAPSLGRREACAADMACQGPDPTVVWNALRSIAVRPGGGRPGRLSHGDEMVRAPAVGRAAPGAALPAPAFERIGRADAAPAGWTRRLPGSTKGLPRRRTSRSRPTGRSWRWPTRKGNQAEARRWLDRLRTWRPDSSVPFWDLQEIELVRKEAAAQ